MSKWVVVLPEDMYDEVVFSGEGRFVQGDDGAYLIDREVLEDIFDDFLMRMFVQAALGGCCDQYVTVMDEASYNEDMEYEIILDETDYTDD